MPGFAKVLKEGRSHFQIGDNTNLFDWTYVGNVAYAHILAADKLVPRPPSTPETVAQALDTALPSIDLTTGQHRVPTSSARPLGPCVEPPQEADAILAAFEGPHSPERPVVRSRFDQLSQPALKRAGTDPLQVAGQVFFITNGEPVYFWDFPRRLWRMLAPDSYPAREPFVLPKSVGFAIATLSEWWGWFSGHEPTFTRFRVTFTCAHRWHNIEKARRVLGYEPQVGLEEGMKRTVEVRALLDVIDLTLVSDALFTISGGKPRRPSRHHEHYCIYYLRSSYTLCILAFLRLLVYARLACNYYESA